MNEVILTKDGERNTIHMIDSSGRAWTIRREDADPDHRHKAYRVAASYFRNSPQPNS